MPDQWWAEIQRALVVVLIGTASGVLLGSPALGFGLGVAAYLGWHYQQLYRFDRWLRQGSKRSRNPRVGGIWADQVQHVYQLKKRSRQRKKRLTAMLGRFNASTSALPDAVVILGRNGDIEWVNRAAQPLLGVRPRDVGQRLINLVRDPLFLEYYERADFESELELPSPERADLLLSLRVVPFGDDSRLVMARDISEPARLRQMRRDFVANVSHELRTPLTVITGYLETFAAEEGLPPQLYDQLTTLVQQTERMNRLVADLLTLSRLEHTRLEASEEQCILVGPVLAGLVEDARKISTATGHRLIVECAPDLNVRGREVEINSVFGNLIQNAIQHTPEGTRVHIRWKPAAGGRALFEVEDNGPGIEAQHLDRLTERFYRVDAGRSRASGGTGLGLSIVKHILQRHDCELHVNSELGRGTRFSCLFPPERVVRTEADQQAAG